MSMESGGADALLMIVQQNQAAMDRVFAELEKLHGSVGQVRERMAAMEASSVQPQVTELRADVSNLRERVAVLEGDKQTRVEVAKSQSTIAEWVFKLAPWLFVTAYVVITQWQTTLSQ